MTKQEKDYINYITKVKEIKAFKANNESKIEENGLVKTKKEPNSDAFVGALNYTTMNEYRLGRMLGQGAYAMVREAMHIQTGYYVAIKIYDKYKLNQLPQIKKSVMREIKMLLFMSKKKTVNEVGDQEENFGHPNIMKLYDAIDTQRQLYLVCENCKG